MAADPVSSTNVTQTSDASEFLVNYELGPVMATGRLPLAAARQLLMSSLAPSVALVSDLTLDWPEGVEARVYGEASDDAKGVYRKVGASGGGSWTRIGPLPAEDSTALAAETGIRQAADAEANRAVAASAQGDRALPGLEPPWLLRDVNNAIGVLFDHLGRLNIFSSVQGLWHRSIDPFYRWLVVGKSAGLVIGVTHNGDLHAEGALNRGIEAYIGASGDVMIIEGHSETFNIQTPSAVTAAVQSGDVHLSPKVFGRRVYWVRRSPLGGETRQYAWLDAKPNVAAGVTKIIVIYYTGQSNGNGTGGNTALTTTSLAAGRVKMPPNGFRIFRNSQGSATRDLPVMSDVLSQSWVEAAEVVNTDGETGLAQTLGVIAVGGGATIATFGRTLAIDAQALTSRNKGTEPYRNLMRAARADALIAARAGLQIEVHVVDIGGETENAAVSAAAMQATLQQYQTDLNADVKAITGQAANVKLFVEQNHSYAVAGGSTVSEVPVGLVDAAAANADIILLNPKYHLPHGDGTHLTSAGHRDKGWDRGETARRVLIAGGGGWTPLKMAAASRAGAVLTVSFDGLAGVLTSDASVVSDPGNFGFTVRTAADAAVTISSSAIVGNTVELTCSADPGAGARVELALRHPLGSGAGPTTGPRSTLRDSIALGAGPAGTIYKRPCAGRVITN